MQRRRESGKTEKTMFAIQRTLLVPPAHLPLPRRPSPSVVGPDLVDLLEHDHLLALELLVVLVVVEVLLTAGRMRMREKNQREREERERMRGRACEKGSVGLVAGGRARVGASALALGRAWAGAGVPSPVTR